MSAVYVDFSEIAPQHRQIDVRCVNWARWAVTNTRSVVQPMFRLYRSAEVHDDGQQNAQKPTPIDSIDALRVENAVAWLPEKHRTAIRWAYIVRCQPIRMCHELGVSRGNLAVLIHESRTMLLNRL